MGTDCQIVVLDGGDDDLAAAQAEVHRLEALWSRFRPDSELSGINAQAGRALPASAETRMLARRALRAERLTAGRFDPLMGADLVALGYDRDHGALPAPAGPSATVVMTPVVRPRGAQLRLDECTGLVTVPAGRALDPGGIGKGLAADMVTAGLIRRGVGGALVNLGGDIRCRGITPSGGWRIGIDDPRDPEASSVATVNLSRGAVCTSGVRKRRWMRRDGTVAHHLLDPDTGAPTDAEVASVSVIARLGWLAEALTKALILGGPEVGTRLLRAHNAGAVVVLADGAVHRLP
jgi:thiamine biosynthesis lipoprotein